MIPRLFLLSQLLAAAAPGLAAPPAPAPAPAATNPASLTEVEGLLPVRVDKSGGRVFLSLPAPDAEGISGRFIYLTSLETGLGSAPIGLDRAQSSDSRLLVFRRVGRKMIAEIENPRFRAGAGPAEQEGVRRSFAYSTLWMGDVTEQPDGRLLVDFSAFVTRDDLDIVGALKRGGGGEFKLVPEL